MPDEGVWTHPNGHEVSSPTLAEDWPVTEGGGSFAGGGTLDADPSEIRGFATNAAAMSGNLSEDISSRAQYIADAGERMSTGGFGPGSVAQGRSDAAGTWMVAELATCAMNLTAISMASHTCADLLGNADDLSALSVNDVNFGFADPTASKRETLHEWLEKNQVEAGDGEGGFEFVEEYVTDESFSVGEGVTVRVYEGPDGAQRLTLLYPDESTKSFELTEDGSVTTRTSINPDGTSTTRRYNDDGALTEETLGAGNGRYTTTSYDDETGEVNQVVEQEVRSENNYYPDGQHAWTDEHRVTSTYDAEGNLTNESIHTERTYTDGRREIGSTEDGTFTPDRYFEAPQANDMYPYGMTAEDHAAITAETLREIDEQMPSIPGSRGT